jgi:hypothetical protein
MGRPLKKDVNGVEVLGTFGTNTPGDSNTGIRCEFHDGTALRTDGILVRQRGAKTYVVTRVGNLNATHLENSTSLNTCVLQSAEPAAAGQMRIRGSVAGTVPGDIAIAKLTKRIATDFSGNRYNWEMVNFADSSGDAIKLTAI